MIFSYPIWKLKHNSISIHSDISRGLFIRNSKIENYVFIGRNCTISNAEIGAYTCIAAYTQIGGMEHPYWELTISPRLTDEFIYDKKTVIGHDVWIGSGCIIRQGISIGDGAVVGANSFVNKDVPPYTIVAGSPAVPIKIREVKKKEQLLHKSKYWERKPVDAKIILSDIKKRGNS